MYPVDIITKFDAFLEKKGITFDAIIIGGAALSFMNVITRETQDVDVLDPEITEEIKEAAKSFAKNFSISETSLKETWLNNGPSSLVKELPAGGRKRRKKVFSDKAITLHTLSRMDLLGTKLFALCDRGLDLNDCLSLAPTRGELLATLEWVKYQDANPDWPAHVTKTLEKLAKRLGYEL